MTDPNGDQGASVDVVESDAERVESREYGFALRASATLDGPEGRMLVRRRYEALPYHNDDLYPDEPDSNDELTDRPNEIHVHTRFYAVTDDEPEYVADVHETWTPESAELLGDPEALAERCTAHHLADPAALYRNAIERR